MENAQNKHVNHHFGGMLALKSGLQFFVSASEVLFFGTWKQAVLSKRLNNFISCCWNIDCWQYTFLGIAFLLGVLRSDRKSASWFGLATPNKYLLRQIQNQWSPYPKCSLLHPSSSRESNHFTKGYKSLLVKWHFLCLSYSLIWSASKTPTSLPNYILRKNLL